MRVGIIDIGSNTIKLLVADVGEDVTFIHEKYLDLRMGTALGSDSPMNIPIDTIEAAAVAAGDLVKDAQEHGAERIKIVATSAVRDAQNQQHFADAIYSVIGHKLHILSGMEEARGICRGVALDEALLRHPEFLLADLGGGSLELIHYRRPDVIAENSMQLGAIRVTEKFIGDPHQPIIEAEANNVQAHVAQVINAAGFLLENSRTLVGTGGALSLTRRLYAEEQKLSDTESSYIPISYLRNAYRKIASLTSEHRCATVNISPGRADIMPVALLTLITLAELVGVDGYQHSRLNLRYGVAAEFIL